MAKYVIPPNDVIVKCSCCKALYVPDRSKDMRWMSTKKFASFEKCPVCGNGDNTYKHTIPLWKYNLIRYWRGRHKEEKEE